eukprot:4744840-Pleurochrysis_carterae.AAC.1
MIRRRPTELPESLENSAPQGSPLSSLINQYNETLDPVERISLFRQLGEESEKPEYSEQSEQDEYGDQINSQLPDETVPTAADDQVGSQAPDESLPPGVDEQMNAQGPSETETPMEEPKPKNTPKTQEELDKIEMR